MKMLLISVLTFILISCASQQPKKLYQEYYEPVNGIDKRLGVFLKQAIDDKKDYDAVINEFKDKPISLEYFIYQVFTSKVKFDNTEDNMFILGKLGLYLSNEKPKISKELYDDLVKFNETNNTFMRGMLLMTIKDIIEENY